MAAARAAFQQTGPFGKDGISDSEDEDDDEDDDEDEDEDEDDDDEVDEDDDDGSSEAEADSGLLFYTKSSCNLILTCRVDE